MTITSIQPKSILLMLTILVTLFVNVQAQSLPAGFSEKIDRLFATYNKPGSPGCVIGIVRNDSLLYAKGYGMANLEYGIPNTPETIYHMASVSKQFAAYAIVLLEKAGRLRFDDDIRSHLSWFPDLKEKITIRHLLNHTSGIRDQWQLLAIAGTRIDDVITQGHIVKLLSQQRTLNFKPGEKYIYSNSGFTLLAEIVKAATAQTLRQFTDSAIFKPLGMSTTHFHDDYTEVVPNRSYSYSRKDSAGFRNEILSYSNAGATSLFTNIRDMSRWIMNLYSPVVGNNSFIETLTQRGRLNNGKELSYALGISLGNYKGWKQYSHGGADAGYRTYVTAFPDLKLGIMVFSNLADFNLRTAVNGLADLFIRETTASVSMSVAAIDSSAAPIRDLDAISPFIGDYISEDGAQASFELKDQKLYWKRYGQSDLLQKAMGDTFSLVQNPGVRFVLRKAGDNYTTVQQIWPDGERILQKYTAADTISRKKLQDYVGEYYCQELDSRYTIRLNDQHLILSHTKYEDTPLKFVGKDDLFSEHWWMGHLKVLRNSKQQITGFEVNDGRIMHLKFTKLK